MLELGKISSLAITRAVPMGVMLRSAEEEVLLPARFVPDDAEPGDRIDVFLYRDSEDRPIATTERPKALVDEFASLRVVSVNATGAFLDWGLPKDLLLPFQMQREPVSCDEHVVVRVLLDSVSERLVASTFVERFLDPPPKSLREGQAVNLMAYEETELGSKTIVNQRFGGLLYYDSDENRSGRHLELGRSDTGYVKRIRSDGKIDLSLAQSGQTAIETAREVILEALAKSGGRLELGDRSEPEAIRSALGMSKKAFKRAVGALYRERKIIVEAASIQLTDKIKK